jgi:hypothetical protein
MRDLVVEIDRAPGRGRGVLKGITEISIIFFMVIYTEYVLL